MALHGTNWTLSLKIVTADAFLLPQNPITNQLNLNAARLKMRVYKLTRNNPILQTKERELQQ